MEPQRDWYVPGSCQKINLFCVCADTKYFIKTSEKRQQLLWVCEYARPVWMVDTQHQHKVLHKQNNMELISGHETPIADDEYRVRSTKSWRNYN